MSLKFNSDIIENYRTIVIPLLFNGSQTTSVNISNIEFTPDEMIINSIAYLDSSANQTLNPPILSLSSNLSSNYAICSFPNYETIAAYVKLDTPFKLNSSVNGNYIFTLQQAISPDTVYFNPSGYWLETSIAALNFRLSLTITFYKYKSADKMKK